MATCNPLDIQSDDVAKNVESEIARLDSERARSMTGLQTVRTARATMLTREKRRLTLKYGAAHARVTNLSERIRSNNQFVRDLNFETGRAEVEPPVVSERGYAFHGFVLDASGSGVPQLTVALYDESGKWIELLGYGCTDARGYFSMRYDPADNSGKEPIEKPLKEATFAARAAVTGAAASTGTGVQARVHVLNSDQKTIHIEADPLNPQPGAVDYRVITLGQQPGSCTPPPPKTKDPAPPPKPTPERDPKPSPEKPTPQPREPLPPTVTRPIQPVFSPKPTPVVTKPQPEVPPTRPTSPSPPSRVVTPPAVKQPVEPGAQPRPLPSPKPAAGAEKPKVEPNAPAKPATPTIQPRDRVAPVVTQPTSPAARPSPKPKPTSAVAKPKKEVDLRVKPKPIASAKRTITRRKPPSS